MSAPDLRTAYLTDVIRQFRMFKGQSAQ